MTPEKRFKKDLEEGMLYLKVTGKPVIIPIPDLSINSKKESESSVDLIHRYRDEYAEQGNEESNCVDESKKVSQK